MHDCARSATEPSKNTTKNVTKTLEFMIFAHVQNLGPSQTFSNVFSGVPRARQQLHMHSAQTILAKTNWCNSSYGKKNEQKVQIILAHLIRSLPAVVITSCKMWNYSVGQTQWIT